MNLNNSAEHSRSGNPSPRIKVSGGQGFALVVTLSLMLLLVLLAFGLLGLSSVSLRTSGHGLAMAEARSHARLAMMIALGELQSAAGPDLRVTATADLAGDTGGGRLAAGKQVVNLKSVNGVSNGLTMVQPGSRHWAGVWDSVSASSPASQIYTRTPGATNVRWLVSGNETGAGQLFTPASPVVAVGGDGSLSDPAAAALLVGPNSVGTAEAGGTDRFVVAPMVAIDIKQPGAANRRGRYAWWIGDEGVKSRVDLAQTVADPERYASLVPQRRGWETVVQTKDYPAPDTSAGQLLPRAVTLKELELLLPGARDGRLGSLFHAATADSMGVIADTLNGGTRVDLSRLLAASLPSSNPVPAIPNYPVTRSNIIPASWAPTIKAPKWDVLKDFRDRYQSLDEGSLVVRPGNGNGVAAIAPIIAEFRILMGVRYVPAGAGFKANGCGKIAVVIANPYPYPLKWERDLEFEITNASLPGNRPSRIWSLGGNTVFLPDTTSEEAVFNQAVFTLKPGVLAAGQARAYTLAGSTKRALGSGNRRQNVELTAFGPSGADFKNCIELETNGVWTPASPTDPVFPAAGLEVREGTQTCTIHLEMRLGTGQPLRKLERFELDTGYRFTENVVKPTGDECRRKSQPVSLLCYGFQLSRPGMDYLSMMPGTYEMGMRGSTFRTFMDFNLQASRFGKPITSYNPPPFFMQTNSAFSDLDSGPAGGDTGMVFTRNLLADPLPWAHSANGPKSAVLFSVPKELTSLAQFQHADLTGDDTRGSISHQPGYAFANSYAPPFVKRSLTTQQRTDYTYRGVPDWVGYEHVRNNYYDISYLLNAALWDTWFLSGMDGDSSAGVTGNPAFIPYGASASGSGAPGAEAARLLINGAFNVNCTEPDAWKAFLASTRHFRHRADTVAQTHAAYPRTLEQPAPATIPATGKGDDSFAGFRRLTDDELDALATELAKQVRLRGPFVSLSHFVNRALADLSRQPALSRCGALQAAIDEAGINLNFEGTRNGLVGINANKDRVSLGEKNGAPRADCDRNDAAYRPRELDPSQPDWAATSDGHNHSTVASIIADRAMLGSRHRKEQGYRSTAIPGWLTQADVLQAIGPVIAVRSDTFRVRTCGEALATDGKSVLARAWCEAIVQRVPEFIDAANPPHARSTDLTPLNKSLGRRFVIQSFRWLGPDEI